MPLSTEDRLDILDLVARYCYAIDDGDADAYVRTFTDDGVLDAGPTGVFRREAELRGFVEQVSRRDAPIRHLALNPVIEGNGDTAALALYLLVVVPGAPPRILSSGRYRDELRRTADGWRFRYRRFLADAPPTQPS